MQQPMHMLLSTIYKQGNCEIDVTSFSGSLAPSSLPCTDKSPVMRHAREKVGKDEADV